MSATPNFKTTLDPFGRSLAEAFGSIGPLTAKRAPICRQILADVAEAQAADPLVLPRESLRDDDTYVYDAHTLRLIETIGASNNYARAIQSGRVKLPEGQAFATGLRIKLRGIAIWEAA